jgi:alcohol dehydrogenase class IV
MLREAGSSSARYIVRGEPTVDVVDEGVRTALAAGCDWVVGLGGGSVLDAAKAIAVLMTNDGLALDYLEIVGGGRSIERAGAPFLAIPTTAGTGSEVTKNSVLTEPRARVKVSIRSPHMLPSAALIDPELTVSLPPALTASTGLDALTQLIEAYLTPQASEMTDPFALEGIARSARSLRVAMRGGQEIDAREDLALASLYGGLALANAGLGAVHGIAAPLGGRHPVPHGVVCALLLPAVFEANLRALRSTDPCSPALARMARVGEILASPPGGYEREVGADQGEDLAEEAALRLRRLVSDAGFRGLASYGITEADIPPIVAGAQRANSMKGNPIRLPDEALAAAIASAL